MYSLSLSHSGREAKGMIFHARLVSLFFRTGGLNSEEFLESGLRRCISVELLLGFMINSYGAKKNEKKKRRRYNNIVRPLDMSHVDEGHLMT